MVKWFKTLSPTMQILLVIVLVIVAWLIFRNVRGFLQRAGQISETAGEVAALTAQGQQKSYTNSQYASFANQLYYAMKGWGTDEEAIGQVFSKMKNDLDVIALNNAFGVKDGYDLQGWLRGDLSAADMQTYVNGILASKGISKTF